jgi:hypothetical protein
MSGEKMVYDFHYVTVLRPSGARKEGFSSGGSALLHPRLLTFAPNGAISPVRFHNIRTSGFSCLTGYFDTIVLPFFT